MRAGRTGMTTPSEDLQTSSAESGNSHLDDPTEPGVKAEEMIDAELEEASETGWDAGQPPRPEEIRLRAYHRYMERQGGDDDEIADWLAAESELRHGGRGGRAIEQSDAQP
jgi:hypothetical protein